MANLDIAERRLPQGGRIKIRIRQDDRARDLVMVGATAVEIRRKALEEGMLTLRMSGLEKVRQGVTSLEEVLRETVR
jgi:type IV pilus assembly protein PilB